MDNRCNTPTASGLCQYPASSCPLHAGPAAPAAAEDETDPRALVQLALEAAARGEASTIHLQRLIRSLDALEERAGRTTLEQRLKLSFLLGKVIHGIPPDSVEEWELARSHYQDAAIKEFAMWAMLDPSSSEPDWVDDLRDPTLPKYAWRFDHPSGPWADMRGAIQFRITEYDRHFDFSVYSDHPPIWMDEPESKPTHCVLPHEADEFRRGWEQEPYPVVLTPRRDWYLHKYSEPGEPLGGPPNWWREQRAQRRAARAAAQSERERQ